MRSAAKRSTPLKLSPSRSVQLRSILLRGGLHIIVSDNDACIVVRRAVVVGGASGSRHTLRPCSTFKYHERRLPPSLHQQGLKKTYDLKCDCDGRWRPKSPSLDGNANRQEGKPYRQEKTASDCGSSCPDFPLIERLPVGLFTAFTPEKA